MIVSNSSPLIYLAELGDFDLLRTLFSEIAIPPAVFREVVVEGAQFPVAGQVTAAQQAFVSVQPPHDASCAMEFIKAGLHAGESEALCLALELQAEALLIDDADAVAVARKLRINVIRTPSIYRMAKQRGLIEFVAPKLDQLRNAGFWLRDDHYRIILKSVGEA